MPAVSVIVPVYNVEKYLKRCVDSILDQTFMDFELILVDDGSTDSSGLICDEYAECDGRVKVIHKENGGVSTARNTGIDAAQGEFIMFVDSDDYIDKEMLKQMLQHGAADLIFCGLRFITSEGVCQSEHISEYFSCIPLCEFVDKFYLKMERQYITSGPYNKLFSKEILDRYTVRFHEKMSICEDGLFVTEFLKNCSYVSNVDSCYYNYVQYSNGNLMSRFNQNAVKSCEALYCAKADLVEETLSQENKSVMAEIDEKTLGLFIAFFSQIYTRSGYSLKRKKETCKSRASKCHI